MPIPLLHLISLAFYSQIYKIKKYNGPWFFFVIHLLSFVQYLLCALSVTGMYGVVMLTWRGRSWGVTRRLPEASLVWALWACLEIGRLEAGSHCCGVRKLWFLKEILGLLGQLWARDYGLDLVIGLCSLGLMVRIIRPFGLGLLG